MESNQHPTPFQKKTLWRAITGLAILTISCLLIALVWTTGKVLAYLQPVLVPVAVAGIIAYLLDPVVSWLQKKNMSRLKAVLTVFGSFTIVITIFALMIIPPIFKQVGDALNDRENVGYRIAKTVQSWGEVSWIKPAVDWALAPAEEQDKNGASANGQHTTNSTPANTTPEPQPVPPPTPQPPAEAASQPPAPEFSETNLGNFLSENTGKIVSIILNGLSAGTSKAMALLGLIVGFAMVPIYLYYFLAESSAIKENWHNYVPLKASNFKNEVIDCLGEINGYLISFFRGQMLVAMIDGLLVGIALWAFRLPYGLVIGIFMGVIGIIPFVGNIICLIPACLIAYVHFSANPTYLGDNPWTYVGAVVAIFVIVQQINSLVTAPKIVGDSVGLHPMTVIFSMLFWSLLLGGFIGALLAVPLTAAVKVLFRRYIWERKIMEHDPIHPADSQLADDDSDERPSDLDDAPAKA